MKNTNRNFSQVPYPNIYILPKKYNSIKDVKIYDVIKSFPLNVLEYDDFERDYSKKLNNLHFRFETVLYNGKTQKKIIVNKDIVCNEKNYKELENVPVPLSNNNQIKLKVLVVP